MTFVCNATSRDWSRVCDMTTHDEHPPSFDLTLIHQAANARGVAAYWYARGRQDAGQGLNVDADEFRAAEIGRALGGGAMPSVEAAFSHAITAANSITSTNTKRGTK